MAQLPPGFPCHPIACSTLLPEKHIDDPRDDDCAYRAGNLWWLDYVAGTLAWRHNHGAPGSAFHARKSPGRHKRIIVALFDDGAWVDHQDLRGQLWTGRRGEHGWDFVDNSPDVSPKGVCRNQFSHGTMMASLIASRRNNGVGIAAAGSDGARVMILRVVGCTAKDRQLDPARMIRALHFAVRHGARILSFSMHWYARSPELDAVFRQIADDPHSPDAAIVVASVPDGGEPSSGYPAAYPFRRIVRAIPIGNDDMISPGASPAPPGLDLGAPSACVIGAGPPPSGYLVEQGSSNATAILAGLLAGIWSSPRYAKLTPDEFLESVVKERMLATPRRSRPGPWPPYLHGVPLADACLLATPQRTAAVCRTPRLHGHGHP